MPLKNSSEQHSSQEKTPWAVRHAGWGHLQKKGMRTLGYVGFIWGTRKWVIQNLPWITQREGPFRRTLVTKPIYSLGNGDPQEPPPMIPT